MKRCLFLSFVLLVVFLFAACGSGNDDGIETTGNSEEAAGDVTVNEEETAMVEITNGEGQKVGTAELEQTDAGVLIRLEASGLEPGTHGFHIHETGKCEAPKFESAGGHFNPVDASHGVDHEKGPHAGDLPNIEVGEDGAAQTEVTADQVTLKQGEQNSLLSEAGTALIIHAKADDNISQPAGDAGDRIACGVISKALPDK
ncbi:superoxide dismutase family protein [Domibacillus mangrovi]|uniref:Superoxide dismutase [Cu-Zn] n=1 Tax=Domibacillus mangrovi TaxID=1714354 RepID=A0A1Q5P0C9_9BACI|nr:superoxide dismutase family protein [Domibacillus mangrovi]OKL35714.1 superoxide dismutase [Domibacillus mangrovi]